MTCLRSQHKKPGGNHARHFDYESEAQLTAPHLEFPWKRISTAHILHHCACTDKILKNFIIFVRSLLIILWQCPVIISCHPSASFTNTFWILKHHKPYYKLAYFYFIYLPRWLGLIYLAAGWIKLITGAYLPNCQVNKHLLPRQSGGYWIVWNSPGSHVNNVYSPSSDKLTEVQLFLSTSCQPGNQVNKFLLTWPLAE